LSSNVVRQELAVIPIEIIENQLVELENGGTGNRKQKTEARNPRSDIPSFLLSVPQFPNFYPTGIGPHGPELSTRRQTDARITENILIAPGETPSRTKGTFSTHVDPDGRLHFEDEWSFSLGLKMPCGNCKRKLARWMEDPKTMSFSDPITAEDVLPFWPRVEFNDAILRSLGEDPYIYEKMRIANETRAMRAEVMAQTKKLSTKKSLYDLRGRLEEIWNRKDLSAVQRRRLLFAIWDECEDDEAGQQARTTIVGFIRRLQIHFPPEELAGLNRHRLSAEPLAP
jgi:hypothetical protein